MKTNLSTDKMNGLIYFYIRSEILSCLFYMKKEQVLWDTENLELFSELTDIFIYNCQFWECCFEQIYGIKWQSCFLGHFRNYCKCGPNLKAKFMECFLSKLKPTTQTLSFKDKYFNATKFRNGVETSMLRNDGRKHEKPCFYNQPFMFL